MYLVFVPSALVKVSFYVCITDIVITCKFPVVLCRIQFHSILSVVVI